MSALTVYGVPGKMTRRLAGVVLGAQGLAVFFGALVARALSAANGNQTSNTALVAGSLLAVLCVLDAGLLRWSWGVTLGWVLQIATLATAFIVPAMLLVGVLFGALWLTALIQGHAMDEHTSRVDAQWHATQETSGPESPSRPRSTSGPSTSEASGSATSTPETSAYDG
ncbi:MAG: DUF4233 domain-containing protein [Dermatophilaceae bacterium]